MVVTYFECDALSGLEYSILEVWGGGDFAVELDDGWFVEACDGDGGCLEALGVGDLKSATVEGCLECPSQCG